MQRGQAKGSTIVFDLEVYASNMGDRLLTLSDTERETEGVLLIVLKS